MLKAKSTAKVYRNGLRRFISYYRAKHGEDKSFTDFLDDLEKNASLPRKDRKRLADATLVDFINFCTNDGLSDNTMRTYIAAVQNFLKYKGFALSTRWLGNMPRAVPQKTNRKHQWKRSEIKEFVERASTYRDKAIILVLFQSGIGVSDLSHLNYGDICDEYEQGTLPILLDLSRFKTGVDFKTFLGADAVQYLRSYLATRTGVTRDSPLFTMWNSDSRRISIGAIQKKFKEFAKGLSFLRDNGDGMNPARPHSLRSAFRSRLTGKMDGDLIEFFMGHEIGEAKRAYRKFVKNGIDQGRRYVAVVDARDRVIHRPVETGRSVADPGGMLRVIERGLDGTERLVVSGLARARDGSLVRPVTEDDAAPAQQPGVVNP